MNDVEQVWEAYRDALRGFLRRRVSDEDDVDDLLQDILIKTHEKMPDLRDGAKLRGWLFQVARNATTDFYRKRGRDRAITAEDLWYEDKDDPSARRDLERCVRPFIDSLPPEEADLLRVIDLNGVAQKDHAEQLGIPYSTLKSRVAAARRNLGGKFEECCSFARSAQGEIIDFAPRPNRCGNC